ncbi:MAG: serine hydrolase, partial [Ignavibacteriaceae bacterium]|nr:serine hydrolase [Ignavibacteriaceae bacterium]
MHNKVLLNTILASLFIFINCSSFAQDLHNEQSLKTKADSLLKYFYDNDKLMGSVTISKAGKVVYEKAVGYSHITANDKILETMDTRYRIGSISKMFTAVMIFQLIDEKKLSLDVPLSKYFPGIPNSDSITIGNMLNHHSGLYNFTNDSEYAAYHTSPKTEDEMLKIFENHKPEFNPDEKGAYSNTNYVLLGYIIEKITGDSYASQLKKRIIDKIGLDNTYYGHKININNDEASSYTMVDDK